MKQFLSSLLFLFPVSALAQNHYLLVGTYDSPTSEGIYVFNFNAKDGSAVPVSHVKTSNPSFLAISPNQQFVYAVNENADSTGKGGGVTSFSFNKKNGTLTQLSRQSSEGNHPCYITADKTGKWVIAGNYSSGNFAVLPVSKTGMLSKAKKVVQHTGSGPDSSRQRSPHVHAVYLKDGNSELFVPDLGIDKVMTYRFDNKTGNVLTTKMKFAAMPGGTGPRHIDFSPNGKFAYVMLELNSSVSVLKNNGGGYLTEVQNIFSLPPYYRGPMSGADIHVSPDGRFLYCSNRDNANTISIFSIDKNTGMITSVGYEPVLGLKPRNFNFDPSGKFLLVANQNSDEIVVFSRDIETGLLKDTGNRIQVGKPVCLKWITVN
ncbi:MAG: lactonase family protein [Chitinophagaceae bacterium]|nr:lactonase family protein [Chitinophagaceae bacterium]